MSSSTPLRSLRALSGQLQLRAAGPSTFRTRPLCPACLPRHLRQPTLAVRHVSSYPSPLRAEPSASTSSTSASASASAFERAKRSAELSQAKMYAERAQKSRSVMLYGAGAIVLAVGLTYAAVPLYRAFCSATGYSGTPMTDPSRFQPDRLYTTPETQGRKRITVRFEATSSDTLPWSFEPQQRSVRVLPGETALAFYRAKNDSDRDLIGIATYNMTPDKIAPYFAKVECFCFEEQKIRAGEEVDLPVFFFIDRDIMDDPALDGVDDVVLSYTFFKARRNERGHVVPDAPLDVIERSQGFEKYQLARREAASA